MTVACWARGSWWTPACPARMPCSLGVCCSRSRPISLFGTNLGCGAQPWACEALGRGSNQPGAALVPPGSPPLPGFSYDYWTLCLFPVLPTSELPWENGFPAPPRAAVAWGGRWAAGGGQRGWADSRLLPPGCWLAAGLCWWKAGPRAPTPRNLLQLQDLRAGRSAAGPAPGQ